MYHHFYTSVIIAFLFINTINANHLIGEHVCTQDEKYTITFEKHVKKNITIREFIWCMSVPPRCSKYITKEVDDIKIVEEDRIRKIDKCCEGYVEDSTQTYCIPLCTSCINGICSAPENCSCVTGFTGLYCNQTCESGFWGQDCTLKCQCSRGGLCNPETGNCICEAGTTGSKCEISLYPSSSNTTVENSSILETTKNETKEPDVIKNITLLPVQQSSTNIPSSSSRPETTTHQQINKKEKNHSLDYSTSIATSKKNFNSIGKTHQFSDKKPEQLQMNQNTIENDNSHVRNTLLVFIISIAVGVAVILILVAIMSIMIARYKKQRDLAIKKVLTIKSSIDNNNKNRLSTEPIIQRSVFHAPLPDPPIFHNPTFTLRDSQNISKLQYSNLSELNTIQSLPQYDFPPSSGSYRAASLPDSSLEMTAEHVYDEIPASRRPRPVSTLGNCRHSCCENAPCQWNNT